MTKPKPLPEIEKCPSCAAHGHADDVKVYHWGNTYFVGCDVCILTGPYLKTERGAINAWNKLMKGKG